MKVRATRALRGFGLAYSSGDEFDLPKQRVDELNKGRKKPLVVTVVVDKSTTKKDTGSKKAGSKDEAK